MCVYVPIYFYINIVTYTLKNIFNLSFDTFITTPAMDPSLLVIPK